MAWTLADSPTNHTIHDVQYASDTVYAVGAGGVVLRRTADGWTTIAEGGSDLHALDVTDDGRHLWMAGTGGTVRQYDVDTKAMADHSPPGVDGDVTEIAVSGDGGAAHVYVATDAGRIHANFENGTPSAWTVSTPGKGAAITAIDFHGPTRGHAVDADARVFYTADATTWQRLDFRNTDESMYGLDSNGRTEVTLSGAGGEIHYLRSDGLMWIDNDVGHSVLYDVEVVGSGHESPGLAVGSRGSIYRRHENRWLEEESPTRESLHAVSLGGTRKTPDIGGSPDVAVGTDGTILEYRNR